MYRNRRLWDLAFLQIPKIMGGNRRILRREGLRERLAVIVILDVFVSETLGLELAERLRRMLPRRARLILRILVNKVANTLALEIRRSNEGVAALKSRDR